MSTSDACTELPAVLADSYLILAYLRDSGLGGGEALATAAIAAERALAENRCAEGLAALGEPIAAAVQQLVPYISLNDLREGRSPFARDSKAAGGQSAKRFLSAFAAVVLILAVVLGFSITQDVSRDLLELQRILLQDPQQKLVELRRMLDERPLNDPKSAYYLQYRKALAEVNLMFESANFIIARTSEVDVQRPNGMAGELATMLTKETIGLHSNRPPPDSDIGDASLPPTPPTPDCARREANVARAGPYDQTLLSAAGDLSDDLCLVQTLGINKGGYTTYAANNAIAMLQEELFIIGVLFLPLVGGLLGANIFVIQRQLPTSLNPPMTWGYLIARMLMGGAFGVMIGWFSSNQASSLDFAQHVSGTPFTLAIITGFSIETLFSVIVRYSKQGVPPPQRVRRPSAVKTKNT